jgi:galactose-1-phosphate uridylyltransferase
MSQQIDRAALGRILQAESIETLPFHQLVKLFREEEGIDAYLPDGLCQTDPRNGDRVLFNSSRARRPHDNLPNPFIEAQASQDCVVCQGRTTGAIDVADLTEGFSFINKNLYPSLYPWEINRSDHFADGVDENPGLSLLPFGLHFLQWTSSLHDKDWHNMPLGDRVAVMRRLAALEKKLLTDAEVFFRSSKRYESPSGAQAFVLIIKNYGRLVGGSLAHGHQQIALSNVMPRRFGDNWRFEQERGERFSAYLMRENPAKLCIRDYGSAMLLVPYFMRRPYDMMLLVKDAGKRYLYELTEAETMAVSEGWHDALRAIHWIMPEVDRELAYNVITHNGPGAGLYFEFLPYTQETGGFEHLGLLVCQGNPASAATQIREYLEQ